MTDPALRILLSPPVETGAVAGQVNDADAAFHTVAADKVPPDIAA